MDCAFVSETLPGAPRYAYARRCFSLPEGVVQGNLRLAAELFAMLWVNGRYVGRTYLRTHTDEFRYETFDLSPHLRAGENVVALLLHTWSRPPKKYPGVPKIRPVRFCCQGRAGAVDLGDLSAWRVAPADEYRPAPRHNGLIGQEEDRDLRLEPIGWNRPDFDDSHWVVPLVRPLTDQTFLPSPLRLLREELLFPERIVAQGALTEGAAFGPAEPPADRPHWQIEFDAPGSRENWFYLTRRADSRLWVDGEENPFAVDLEFPWQSHHHPVRMSLPAGRHVLRGLCPDEHGFNFGWRHLPVGGDRVAWATDADGPFEPADPPPKPRPETALLLNSVIDEPRCTLGPNGQLDLLVEDEEFSVVLEFPYSITMLPRIEIADADAGARLELVYSERLSGIDGLTIPAAYKDRATLRQGPQDYDVSFQYKSARVLIVNIRARGGRVRIRRVAALFRHYDYDLTGTFACSDERLERIWWICRNTMIGGSQEFIMDGPWREQMLYIGDNHVHNRACYVLFGNSELVAWQHTLYAAGQMPDGIFQPNQPCRTGPKEYRLLDQTILWPMQLEHHRDYTGEGEFIEGLLGNMVRLMDGFQEQFGRADAEDVRLRDVTGWNWVDHPGVVDGVSRKIRHDGVPTGINLLYLESLAASVRLLNAYGRRDEAKRLQQTADALAGRLRELHWDPAAEMFADCVVDGRPSPERSVHVNLLAIEAGLAPDPGALLDRTWKRPSVLQICGAFFRIHLFEVLHRLGRFQAILDDTREFWGTMIDADLTTTAEFMPTNGEWGASVGHPWGASPAIYFVRSLAGLSPLEPGWKKTAFAPHLCDLDSLHVRVPTPHGVIDADLQAENGAVTGTVTAPEAIEIVAADPAPDVIVRPG